MARSPTPTDDDANAVRLRGRLAAAPEVRVLPSGDEITTWRVVVPRAAKDTPPRSDGRKAAGVDTLDCSTRRAGLRKQAQSWQPDDVLELDGAIQRRFYRKDGQLLSRHEVVVHNARRITRAPAQ